MSIDPVTSFGAETLAAISAGGSQTRGSEAEADADFGDCGAPSASLCPTKAKTTKKTSVVKNSDIALSSRIDNSTNRETLTISTGGRLAQLG
ncbi:hypothetical protein FM996_15630 [Methylosinus sporium]|uniref:Uncharacterized protein n=1 Tax=Methylosinus sporium TaxID=428 RepID=A0A549SMB4_METSR|nr:hypothetical protein [Methylosinus sporium]TRL30762.1 hypothetical protein FM996_15630 [Methylosinus sporium]